MKAICIPIAVLFSLVFVLFSCDKIDPKDRFEKKSIDTTKIIIDTTKVTEIVYKQNVLLEDFTGHTCGNCPGAAKLIDTLLVKYPERLIPVAVHAGSFAIPESGNFSYDFRCAEGNTIDGFFGNSNAGNPNGMINRKGWPNTHIRYMPDWKTMIETEMAKAPDVGITITNTYNASTRALSVSLSIKALSLLSGAYKLVVNLTEDSVIKYQKDYTKTPSEISNYTHKHVLRASLNTVWGDTIGSNIAKNAILTKGYSYSIPAKYNDKHCAVVAYIYKTATYEVIQAAHKKVK